MQDSNSVVLWLGAGGNGYSGYSDNKCVYVLVKGPSEDYTCYVLGIGPAWVKLHTGTLEECKHIAEMYEATGART